MISIEPELIWQGRLQLGDEPGTYGDATYTGLATEFPVTLQSSGSNDSDIVTFQLRAERVKVFQGYVGHKVTIFSYEETSQPYRWKQNKIHEDRLTSDDLQVQIDLSAIKPSDRKKPIWLSIEIEVDTTVAPGLYNDFVLQSLSVTSQNYKYTATFGFQYYTP